MKMSEWQCVRTRMNENSWEKFETWEKEKKRFVSLFVDYAMHRVDNVMTSALSPILDNNDLIVCLKSEIFISKSRV